MAENNKIALTQEEINRVLSGVRTDNANNEKPVEGETAVALTQAELDALFGGKKETVQNDKIAARKANAAKLSAQVNAQRKKQLTAVFGTIELNSEEIEALRLNKVISLDRIIEMPIDIMYDGKKIGTGITGKLHDHAAIKITALESKPR
jgi:flagellar motor switch/type III secretory pathway protein FliN